MHHKFVVFCKTDVRTVTLVDAMTESRATIRPYAVWTGSFNFTANGSASFENAVYLTDPPLVAAYFEEWGQVVALSEPLDWRDEWVAPEWRIGT
jgi:hypothetical protein